MKRILVTGANKGIGYAIVQKILETQEDTFVFLGSRDQIRGQRAVKSLLKISAQWEERLIFLPLDVSSDDSVKQAEELVQSCCGEQGLYAVVNNAGIGWPDSSLRDVLEVNLHGVRRVCDAFIPMLKEGEGRIVNITSAAGPNYVAKCSSSIQCLLTNSETTWTDILAFTQRCFQLKSEAKDFKSAGLGDGSTYGISKACANTYTLNLAKRYPLLKINACTPGFIKTDLTIPIAERQGKTPDEMNMKSPQEATVSTFFLLFDESVESGQYFGSDAKRSPLDRYRAPGSPAYTGN